jgi:hypothetical protein
VAILPTVETDAATGLARIVGLIPANEADLAVALTTTQGGGGGAQSATLLPALETDVAVSLATTQILFGPLFPHANTSDGALVLTFSPVDPQMHQGFVRDGSVTGPVVVTTLANAQLPVAPSQPAGLLRDARGYLVVVEV